MKKADGSNGEKMAALLESVEYWLLLQRADSGSGVHAAIEAAVAAALSLPEYVVSKPPKKGKKRGSSVDLRPALLELAACRSPPPALAGVAEPGLGSALLRFRTACALGNPLLSPAAVLGMLNAVGGVGGEAPAPGGSGSDGDGDGSVGPWALAHVHRSAIVLRAPSRPRPDAQKLRSLVRQEGHLAAARAFGGRGPWAGGLENRREDFDYNKERQ